MNRSDVVIVDYGMGNILSVKRGFESIGARVKVSGDRDCILGASKVVLPGVGAFSEAMNELRKRGLVSVIRGLANRGTPLLGICLGMQLLFEKSEEYGDVNGLALLPGEVIRIPSVENDGKPLKVPHVGWNEIYLTGYNPYNVNLLSNIKSGEAVYFVHSYMVQPSSDSYRLADCFYGNTKIVAVVGFKNIMACQFHPEKSGEVGLQMLKNFCASH